MPAQPVPSTISTSRSSCCFFFLPECTHDDSCMHSTLFFFSQFISVPERMYDYLYVRSTNFFCYSYHFVLERPYIHMITCMCVPLNFFIKFFHYFFKSAVRTELNACTKVHAFIIFFLFIFDH